MEIKRGDSKEQVRQQLQNKLRHKEAAESNAGDFKAGETFDKKLLGPNRPST